MTAAPGFLKPHRDGVCLHLKVQPRASRTELGGVLGEELKVKVTAPPVDSAANEAMLDFLAEILSCARQQCVLLRGATSRHKQVLVRGLSLEMARQRLEAASSR